MRKIHLALGVTDIKASIADYSAQLGMDPVVVIPGEYALWRTDTLNLSIRHTPHLQPGSLRHLGWEDPAAPEFTCQTDCNGILWETFAPEHQDQEIRSIWPENLA